MSDTPIVTTDNVAVTNLGVNVDISKSKKPRKRPINQHSNFLLTVNTQQRPKTDEEAREIAGRLSSAMDSFLKSPQHQSNLFKLTPGKETTDGRPAEIRSLNFEFAVEVGKGAKGGRVHSHTIIKTIHNTHIQVDAEYVRQVMPAMVGVPKLFVNVRWLRTDHSVEDYIRKDQDLGDDDDGGGGEDDDYQ